jgi:hypothetical protein
LKTKSSERVVPVHPQLIELGFLNYVVERRKEGEHPWADQARQVCSEVLDQRVFQ